MTKEWIGEQEGTWDVVMMRRRRRRKRTTQQKQLLTAESKHPNAAICKQKQTEINGKMNFKALIVKEFMWK